MVMIDPTLFKSEWFVNLDVNDRYMYLYLLVNASPKTGVFEWNERMINFCANTKKHYTREKILSVYGNRIQQVPGHDNTLIIVDYIRFNWLKDGRVLDPERNRLDRAIVKELNQYGLTIEKLNTMSKHKIEEAVRDTTDTVPDADVHSIQKIDTSITKKDVDEMFDSFWNEYPKCIRKVDKAKCRTSFGVALGTDPDKAVSLFNIMIESLKKWKVSEDWTKDGGRYICAPLVWLHQQRWETPVDANPNDMVKPKKKVEVKESDWIVCFERCANCDGHRCLCGTKIPCTMWEHPTAPEECPKYKEK